MIGQNFNYFMQSMMNFDVKKKLLKENLNDGNVQIIKNEQSTSSDDEYEKELYNQND